MPSIRALYNDELVEAHREAVATLRELLAQEKDPLERRKLANAILRARPVKEEALPPSPAKLGRADRAKHEKPEAKQSDLQDRFITAESARPGEGALNRLALLPARRGEGAAGSAAADEGFLPSESNETTSLDHDDDFDDLAHQLQHGPDRLAALHKLHAIMTDNMAATTPSAFAIEST